MLGAERPTDASASCTGQLKTGVGGPPWLWVWFAWYLIEIPGRLTVWRDTLGPVAIGHGIAEEVRAQPGFWLVQVTQSTRLAAEVALLVGVMVVAIPQLRGHWVERRFRLEAAPEAPGNALDEIEGFIGRLAPGVAIRVNLRRTDQLAFVYPIGYKGAAVAVFAGLVKLWRSDREAAEAVLVHELAHIARGDHHVSGAGSTFSFVVRASAPIFTVLALVPLLIADPLGLVRGFVWFDPFAVLATLVLPVTALWLNEIEADRVVVRTGRGAGLDRALAAGRHRRRMPWIWMLHRLAHPPERLRRMIASRGDAPRWSIGLRCIYPAATLVLWIPLVLGAMLAVASDVEQTAADGLEQAVELVRGSVPGTSRRLVVDAAVLALWPGVADRLAAIWCGGPRSHRSVSAAGPLASSALVMAAGLSLLVARLPMEPGIERSDVAVDADESKGFPTDASDLPAGAAVEEIFDGAPWTGALAAPERNDVLPVRVCGTLVATAPSVAHGERWSGDLQVDWWTLTFDSADDAYQALESFRSTIAACAGFSEARVEPSTQIGGASLRLVGPGDQQVDTVMVVSGHNAAVVSIESSDRSVGDAHVARVAALSLSYLPAL